MSQLETVMLVVLGFAVASLIALFFGKFAWNVAYRLGARRTRKQIPANLIELQADKDRLRAEYAMLQRRSEILAENLKARETGQIAEVMRNRNRIGALGEELDSRNRLLSEQAAELQTLREQFAVAEQELARRTESNQALEARLRETEEALAQRQWVEPPRPVQGEPVQLETYRPQPIPPPREPELAETQDRLSRRICDLTKLSDQIRSQRPQTAAGRLPLHEIRAIPAQPPQPARVFTDPDYDAPKAQNDTAVAGFSMRDDQWGVELAPQPPAPEEKTLPPSPVSPSIANVISLAQRLRALKKDVTS